MRPVYPQPGYTEEEAKAVIESRQSVFMDCYTIIPLVGDPIRYTTSQKTRESIVPVGEEARQFYTSQVLIQGLRMSNHLGVEVDQKQIQIDYPDSLLYHGALTWPQAILQGRLDGGSLRRDRYFAESWNSPWVGGTPIFLGLISTCDSVGRQTATINVKSELVLLNRQAPPVLWEANCKNTWGDPGCGINQDDWAVHGTTGVGTSRTVLKWSGASVDYNLGKIHMTNGDDVTRVRTISRATATELYLAYPLDFDPLVGADFTAYPGCSRTNDASHGCPKFWGDDWRKHFKGAPFIPVAETGV